VISVFHLLDQAWPQRIGGVEHFIHHLFTGKYQKISEFDFSIVTHHPKLLESSYSFTDLLKKSKARSLSPGTLGSSLDLQGGQLKKGEAIFHIHQLLPYGLPNLTDLASRYPCVLTLHDYFLFCPRVHLFPYRSHQCSGPTLIKCAGCLSQKIMNPLYLPALWLRSTQVRKLLKQLKAIILPNSELSDLFEASVLEKIKIIPYAVPERPKTDGFSQKKGFVFLGTLAPHKGIFSLLKELESIGFNREIDLYGPRTHETLYLPKFASYRGVLTDYSQLESYEALILPSLWKETGPLVLLEALRAGIHVLARKGSVSSTYSDSFALQFFESAKDILDWKPSPEPVNPLKNLPGLNEVRNEYLRVYRHLL
jgi:glycosyltransferase involved in cell wall biosynthesis